MRWVYLVLLVVIVTVIIVFITQNRDNQTVSFFGHSLTASSCRGFSSRCTFWACGAEGPSSAL